MGEPGESGGAETAAPPCLAGGPVPCAGVWTPWSECIGRCGEMEVRKLARGAKCDGEQCPAGAYTRLFSVERKRFCGIWGACWGGVRGCVGGDRGNQGGV